MIKQKESNKMPLTQRDKKFYEYLCETRLPILSIDASKLFYRSSTDNARSSIVICQRRAKQMQKEQYIEISKKGFGGSVFYYKSVNFSLVRTYILMR